MAKLKVFAGMDFVDGNQVHCFVATTSQKKAAELVKMPLSNLRAYWSVTGNKRDCETALREPETVFYIPKRQEYTDAAKPLRKPNS